MSTATTHIKTKKQLAPALRFKGFEGDWDLRFLSEFINDMGSGWSPTCLAEAAIKGEWGSLKTTSITWGGYAPEENKKLPEKLEPREDIEVCIDDILITRVGPKDRVGVVVHVDKEWSKLMVSDNMFRLKLKGEIDPSFTPLILGSYSVQKEWKRKIAGLASAQVVINQKTLNKTTLKLPSLPEQQKIASFLSAVDEKIQRLTKKKALLEQYKKGVMQQLFSGQLRFKDENGNPYPDWEEKRLGEYLVHRSTRNKDLNVELVLSVSNKKGFISQNEQFDGHKVASKDLSNYKIVDKDDIAYNPSRINVGSIARLINFEKGIVSPMYVIFSLKEDLDKIYFENLYNIHRFKHLIKVGCSGSVRDSLNFDDLCDFEFKFPSIEEQQKIATYLSRIDTKIEAVNNQMTQTQTFKKGLLQQMFV